jgi:4-hydroxybenzoate polyprenyltransferase
MSNKLYFAVIYSLLFVVAPLILFVTKIWNASGKKEFHFLSTILKWVIFFGILSVLIITLNIKFNAKG